MTLDDVCMCLSPETGSVLVKHKVLGDTRTLRCFREGTISDFADSSLARAHPFFEFPSPYRPDEFDIQ